jgi:hypothetical protein
VKDGMNDDDRKKSPAAPLRQALRIELPLEFCPACWARLESRHCKMICPRCGYFMSCSEFE